MTCNKSRTAFVTDAVFSIDKGVVIGYYIGDRGIWYIQKTPVSMPEKRRGGTRVMNQHIDIDAVVNRLKRIEGQVRGLIKMVEGDKSCEEILIQIGSVKSALHKTGQVILEGHMQHCVIDAIHEGKEEETIKKLSSAIEQFSRIV